MPTQLHHKTETSNSSKNQKKEVVDTIEVSCKSCVFFSKITASDKGVCYNIHSEKVLEVVEKNGSCEKFILTTEPSEN